MMSERLRREEKPLVIGKDILRDERRDVDAHRHRTLLTENNDISIRNIAFHIRL